MKKIIKLTGILLAATALLGLTGCPGNVEKHEHTFAEEWSKDATHHWHAATCEHEDEVDGKAAHGFGEWSEGSRICLICEYEQTCEHTFGEWNEGKRLCSVCGYEQTCEHTWNEWTDGSRICSICDYEQTCEHTWDAGVVTKPATEFAKGEIKYTCDVCGATETKVITIWYESPVDAEKGLAATASSTYVYFGVFPKTVLPSDSTVTVDEDDFVQMGANTYFKGSDGEYYAKVLENAKNTTAEYVYSNGEPVQPKTENSYRYFKVEPIKWKVLTTTYDIDGEAGSDTGALLLAEEILTAGVTYYGNTQDRTINGNTVYANNYEHSEIRAYLNGLTYKYKFNQDSKWNDIGFLQTAFTATAQSKIVTTTVDNGVDSTRDAAKSIPSASKHICENTNDKIFLLSEKEVTSSEYGFDKYSVEGRGNPRIRFPTDYAMANYAYKSARSYEGGYWRLRSPHYDKAFYAYLVDTDGSAWMGDHTSDSYRGIVPALCLSLQ